jgi:hypothetical protein
VLVRACVMPDSIRADVVINYVRENYMKKYVGAIVCLLFVCVFMYGEIAKSAF